MLWHPKGAEVRRIIEDFWEEIHIENGYELVVTPHIGKAELWETSGHLEYFIENMYTFQKEDEQYVLKPMNCPFHVLIYKSSPRSYRELPIKYAEWGTVYRYERSGTLTGLFRVRGFTQDDAHIFCTRDQLRDEISKVLDLTFNVLKALGFNEWKIELSTWNEGEKEHYMGTVEEWHQAENALSEVLESKSIPYKRMIGEAAFYGPKIDIKILDSSDRLWQCSTVQFDFNLPRRFNLSYMDKDGNEHSPYMIHRVVLGAIERFFGILLEHHKGNLPTWLAPIQVAILPINQNQITLAEQTLKELKTHGIRAIVDDSSNTLGYRVRKSVKEKVPYIVVVGSREEETGLLSVRRHLIGDLGQLSVKELVEQITDETRIT